MPVLVVSSPKTPHNRATAASCRGTNASVQNQPAFAEIDDADLLVAPGCAISDHALDTLEQGLAVDPIVLPRPAGPGR